MNRLLACLIVVTLLSGCELLKPVSEDEVNAEAGRYIHRADVGGYDWYDNGASMTRAVEILRDSTESK